MGTSITLVRASPRNESTPLSFVVVSIRPDPSHVSWISVCSNRRSAFGLSPSTLLCDFILFMLTLASTVLAVTVSSLLVLPLGE
jgi:hypothetical protein